MPKCLLTPCTTSSLFRALEDELDIQPSPKNVRVPGFEQLFGPILMVTANPEFIRGFKFDLGFPLSEYFSFTHSFAIPNSGTQEEPNMMNPMMMPMQTKPTYTFITNLARDVRGQEPGMIMQGKVDNEGKVEGILVKKLARNLSMKVTGSFPSSNVDQGFFGLDFDFEDKNAQHNFKFGPGHFGFSMMQKVHQNLMLGFDYTYLVYLV